MNAFAFADSGLDAQTAQGILLSLAQAIGAIQSGDTSRLRFEELYRHRCVGLRV
jgi:hypothetical protein